MVIKGRFSKRVKSQPRPPRKSPTSQIEQIASLQRKEQKDAALNILHDIAAIVAPIMRHYRLRVRLLCEFFPKSGNLLGLNVNGGQKICIRLRPQHNENMFLPQSELLGTLLHELAHNRCGPHDDKFYKFLDELKNMFYDIQIKGSLQATGFVSFSGMVGGAPYDRDKQTNKLSELKYRSEVRRLGGTAHPANISMKEKMLRAAERRALDNKRCGEEHSNEEAPSDKDLDIISFQSSPVEIDEGDGPTVKKRRLEETHEVIDLTSD